MKYSTLVTLFLLVFSACGGKEARPAGASETGLQASDASDGGAGDSGTGGGVTGDDAGSTQESCTLQDMHCYGSQGSVCCTLTGHSVIVDSAHNCVTINDKYEAFCGLSPDGVCTSSAATTCYAVTDADGNLRLFRGDSLVATSIFGPSIAFCDEAQQQMMSLPECE